MSLTAVMRRVRKQNFAYILGRFRVVRAVYSSGRSAIGFFQRPEQSPGQWHLPTLFSTASVPEIVQSIRDKAVYVGFNLPGHIVDEIMAFALSEPLHAIYDPKGPTFFYADVRNGVASDGRKMPIGGVSDPARCPAVQKVINDPVLRSIVRKYLGHEPREILTILDWSFASSMTDDERRALKHGVIDYHYDVAGYDFVYASFYITDTDRYSGAHVMMQRSHKRKPLRMLFGSARASQEAVYKQFGKENEITIEGPAGTGFVQDTSCYHRASPPTKGDRLMLAVRFIN